MVTCGKELLIRLTFCSLRIMSICNFGYFPFWLRVIIIIMRMMSLFYEDNIFSTTTNLTYGPRLKNKHENHKTIFTIYT